MEGLQQTALQKNGFLRHFMHTTIIELFETHSIVICAPRASRVDNSNSRTLLGVLLACLRRSVGASSRRSYALCGDGPSSEVLTAERSSLRGPPTRGKIGLETLAWLGLPGVNDLVPRAGARVVLESRLFANFELLVFAKFFVLARILLAARPRSAPSGVGNSLVSTA